jgi:hypothetical protein
MSKSKSRKTADVFDGEMMTNQVMLATDMSSVEDMPDEATQADANAYFAGYSDPQVGIDEVRDAWQKEVQARVAGDDELQDQIDQEIQDRTDGDKALQDQIDEHVANHPSSDSGWTPPQDEITEFGLYYWVGSNSPSLGKAGFTPLSRSTVADAASWTLNHRNQASEDQAETFADLAASMDEGGDFTLTVAHGALSATYPVVGHANHEFDQKFYFDVDENNVTGDPSFLSQDVKTWPADYELTFTVTKNVLTYEELIALEHQHHTDDDADLQQQIDDFQDHTHSEYAPKEHVHDSDVDYGVWQGGYSTTDHLNRLPDGKVGMRPTVSLASASYIYIHRTKKDGTEAADTPGEFQAMFDHPNRFFGLDDGSLYHRWIIKSASVDVYDNEVLYITFEPGTHETNDSVNTQWQDWVPSGGVDLDVEIVFPKAAAERDLLALQEDVNQEIQDRVDADDALTERIDALAASTPEYGTGQFGFLGDYKWKQTNTSLPGEAGYYPQGTNLVNTATHITFAYANADGVDQELSFFKIEEVIGDGVPVFLSMSSDTGSVQWQVTGTDNDLVNKRCKLVLDTASIQGVGDLIDEDVSLWPNDATKILTYHAYVQLENELNKKVNKTGDDLTGLLQLRIPMGSRWLGFKHHAPKKADNTNDTSEPWGTSIDIDSLNSFKSQFKVVNRYGDIFKINGGGDAGVHIGPINTHTDFTDPANEAKPVQLHLSAEPTADNHAVNRGYLKEQLAVLSASIGFVYNDHGDYTFKRSTDSAGTGIIWGVDPTGGGFMMNELKTIWIHKTNKDGVTHDLDAFQAGEVLKLTKGTEEVLFSITSLGAGNANNTEVNLQWIAGGEKTILYVNDVINVQEGHVEVPDDVLQEDNVWTGTNQFDAQVTTTRQSTSSGDGLTIYGQVAGSTSLSQKLLSVYYNAVSTDNEDAVNYYGKMSSSTNIVNVGKVQEMVGEAVVSAIPQFATVAPTTVTVVNSLTSVPLTSSRYLVPGNNNGVFQTWPGNVTTIDFFIGDSTHDLVLTMGGQFYITDSGGQLALQGFIIDADAPRYISGKRSQKFYIRKTEAGGREWGVGDPYNLYTSGMWWKA